jgi:HEAT repeat protein
MPDHPSLVRLRTARSKYDISSALDTLGRAPTPFVVDPLVVEMTSDDRWSVRHSTISALGNAVGQDVEDALLRAAERAKDPQDLVYINTALGKIGRHRSLAHLTQAVSHRKEDVATSALAALRKIGSNAQQSCLLAALADRRWAVKWYAMLAIETHGDAAAVDAVLARAKQILRPGRIPRERGRSELVAALGFLWRYRLVRPDVALFFGTFVPPRIARMSAEERVTLEDLT